MVKLLSLISGGAWKYILGGIGLVISLFFVRKSGADAVKNKNNKELLNDMHKANIIRDQLKRDADYSNRVRKRFTK